MRYPKFNGEKMDTLRRKKFDFWRENFSNQIKMTEAVKLTEEQIEVLAWNCAFSVALEDDKSFK